MIWMKTEQDVAFRSPPDPFQKIQIIWIGTEQEFRRTGSVL